MQKVSGFFASHANYNLSNIPLAVTEAVRTFSDPDNVNIWLQENNGFNSGFSKEIFERSLTEKNLVKLHFDTVYRGTKDEQAFRHLYSPTGRQQYLQQKPSYSLSLLSAFSKLRKDVTFRLLYECGTSEEIQSLERQWQLVTQELFHCLMYGQKTQAEKLTVSRIYFLYRKSYCRDMIIQSMIDTLLSQYSNISLQLVFGIAHDDTLLKPYVNRNDLEISVVKYYEPGSEMRIKSCHKIADGIELSEHELQRLVIEDIAGIIGKYVYGEYFKTSMRIGPTVIMEAIMPSFTQPSYELLMGNSVPPFDVMSLMRRIITFLDQTGALDRLTEMSSECKRFVSACMNILENKDEKSVLTS